jgi:hypothetical protein
MEEQPTIKIITLAEYNNTLKDDPYTLEYMENMLSYFSQKQLKIQFNIKKKIKCVLVYTENCDKFIPKQNKTLTYYVPVITPRYWEGVVCEYKISPDKKKELEDKGIDIKKYIYLKADELDYVSYHPYGDCIIVI